MKKLLFSAAVVAFGLASAQSSGLKGVSFVGGTVGYSNTSNAGTKKNEFAIMPILGTFVSPSVAVGGKIGYESSSTKVESTSYTTKVSNGVFTIAPFVRKYWSVGEKLFIFGQLDVPLGFGTNKTEYSYAAANNTKDNYFAWGINIKPGLDYMVNNHWSFETTIGALGYNSNKTEGSTSKDTFNIGLNFSDVTFGVKYLFK